jgi:hypothetical protein
MATDKRHDPGDDLVYRVFAHTRWPEISTDVYARILAATEPVPVRAPVIPLHGHRLNVVAGGLRVLMGGVMVMVFVAGIMAGSQGTHAYAGTSYYHGAGVMMMSALAGEEK